MALGVDCVEREWEEGLWRLRGFYRVGMFDGERVDGLRRYCCWWNRNGFDGLGGA